MDAPPREHQAQNHAEIETGQVGRRDDGADDEEAEGNERRATSVYTGARKNMTRKSTTGSQTGRSPRPGIMPSLSRHKTNKTVWLDER